MTRDTSSAHATLHVNHQDLWLVVAVVQPFKVDVIALTLARHPAYDGMTHTQCLGYSALTDREVVAGGEGDEPWPRTRLEVLVKGRVQADSIAGAIAEAAHTGRFGDGRVFLLPVEQSISIREFHPVVPAV